MPYNNLLVERSCPRKITNFNQLVWNNKILTMDNLTEGGCNKLPITTCVICHEAIESIDHLILNCSLAI